MSKLCIACGFECKSRRQGRGLCAACYMRAWRRGLLDAFPLGYNVPKRTTREAGR